MTVPTGSTWTAGFSEIRPSRRAVGSPYQLAVTAWAASWIVRDRSRTGRMTRS